MQQISNQNLNNEYTRVGIPAIPITSDILDFLGTNKKQEKFIGLLKKGPNQGWKVVTKNKMGNPVFVNEEDIPMVHEDDDYDDYNTPNTSRVDVTLFTEPDATEATSTLRLRKKVKGDKISALYRQLNGTGDIDLIGVTIFESYNGDRWVPLTKQTGDFLLQKL